MEIDARLQSLIDATARQYIEISTTWLDQRRENCAYSLGDAATYDTAEWVRFLRWEIGLIASNEDGSPDDYERLDALMGRIALISSAMAGIDTAEFAAYKVQGKGAAAKWARDPRAAEKAMIRARWESWPDRLAHRRYKAAFARAMLDQCQHLTDEKTITDWCREWERKESESC
ncbi:hypothetical protein CGK74_14925 [Thauera propionica]|uniref:Uncharacterized protein n=2 Tax=Thauera propionica TaxID=2019431 RepID=A0A235EVB7_9RHOO|nr:hypothetical protein CGK74_14925 [Thauera propionica]